MVTTNLANMIQVNLFPTEQILNAVFNFTPTESPGSGFARMGVQTKLLIPLLGTTFLIGVLIFFSYVLHGFVYCCGKSNFWCKKIDTWL
jgi:hypothetical protein